MAQPKSYNYYVGPWVWDTSNPHQESFWRAPDGTVGLLDLRSITAMGKKSIPEGYGFFAVDGTLPAPYVKISEGFYSSATISNATKNQINSFIGYKPSSNLLSEAIWEILTLGSDPTGLTGVMPLMPNSSGDLNLHLGGHSLVKSEKFVYGVHPHTAKVREVIKNNYKKIREGNIEKGTNTYLKYLDFMGEKYGIPDPENHFIPDDLPKEKRVKHDTVITESFNTANSDTLGPDLTWTEISGDTDIVSNEAQVQSSAAASLAQAESALSSDDHYAKLTRIIGGSNTFETSVGPIFRKHSTSSTLTFYLVVARYNTGNVAADDDLELYKCVTGSFTQLGTDAAITEAAGKVIYGSADGSDIYADYDAGTVSFTVTDTAITGNLLTGFRMTLNAGGGTKTSIDNFEAGDLGGGGSSTPYDYSFTSTSW